MDAPKQEAKTSYAFRRRWVVVTVLVSCCLLVFIGMRECGPAAHALIRNRAAGFLQTHFQSQVQFSDFEVKLFPVIHVTISGLVMRHNGRTDIPPLFQVSKVSVYANLSNILRRKPRISLVELTGLQIDTPPRHPGGKPLLHGTDQDLAAKYPAVIDEIRADDAILVILRDNSDKPPSEFPLHHLELRDLSFDKPAAFHAILVNAVPPGDIDATGTFGPWVPEEPADTPAVGKYTFQNANLGALNGISGILSSQGSFNGPLNYLKVEGTTDTPDFALRTAAHPMALHTDFSATVDGTNGNTYLNSVTAQFLHTTLVVKGEIVDLNKALKSRTIELDAVSRNARVEDLIRLADKSDDPVMTGSVKLRAHIEIPEADSDMIDRLRINGQFGIDKGQFTSDAVQGKIDSLSRRGQGQPKDMDINSVNSEIKGTFRMNNAAMNFSDLSFGVDGASINLSGTYGVDDGHLDFHGKLILQAKLSQTMTGAKSFFLKALDPFFSGKNGGTVVAIKITGTRDNPSFGLDRGGHSDRNDPSSAKKDGS
jgi:hypothetical protein